LTENFVSNQDGKVKSKAEEIKGIVDSKCDVKSFELSEPQVTPISPEAAVLTTKATADATCDGQKVPSPVTSATLFVKSGGSWKAAYHNEVPITGSNAPADAANANKPASNANTNAAKPANTSTPKPAATATPKPAATATATPASNTTASTTTTSNTSNSNSNSSADVTNAVVSVEKASWDSWKARDQDKAKLLVTDNVTYLQSNGQIFNGNDAVMKAWYGPQCEIKTVNVADPKVVSVLANVAVLTFKGGATGQCDGKPVSDVWGTSIYVKDGDAWKIAYNLEVPTKKAA
jgi:ketosteroid isomerase-like protein